MRFLLLIVAISLPARALAETIRCGQNLASDGATQAEVLNRCGEPMSKVSRVETVSQETKSWSKNGLVGTTHTITRTIDEWTYNFGPHQFMQLVTFVDGRLQSVRSLSYGK